MTITLNTPISHNHDKLSKKSEVYKNSYLHILDNIQELQFNHPNQEMVNTRRKSMLSRFNSPLRDNPLYSGLLKGAAFSSKNKSKKSLKDDNEEELSFYYLMVMCCLHDRRRPSASQSA